MPHIEINEISGGRIAVHAPSRVIDQLAGAYARTEPPIAYDVALNEGYNSLLTTRADLDLVLASNRELNRQFQRAAVEEADLPVVVNAR